MATKIILRCIDKTLEPISLPKLTSGGKRDIVLEIQFDESWDGYVGKTATFYRDKALVHHATMTSNSCEVPWSVIFDPGVVYVGVFGVSGDILKTTEVLPLDVGQGAIPGPSSVEPIPDIYQQLLNAYGKLNAEQAVANARIDQLVAGGTTVDNAELLDVRVAGDGSTYASAGAAVRANHADLKSLVGAGIVQPYNLLDPFACKKDTGLITATGVEVSADGQWCTDFFPVNAGMVAYSTKDIYKLIGYDTGMAYVSHYSYGATVPDGVAYMRAVFKDTVVPFEDRFGVTISHFGIFPRPIFAFKGTDLSETFVPKQIERSTFAASDFVVAGLAQKTNAVTRKDYLILTSGDYRLVTPYPVRLLKGAVLNVGRHLLRVYQCDKERYWLAGNGANVSTFTADEDMYVMFSIAHETNVPLTNDLINEILADLSIARLDAATNAPDSFGNFMFDLKLTGVTYMSDHTFINGQLYVLNASSDDHNEYATVNVYDVDHDIGSAVLARTFRHNLGHGNSIDYCAGNGCLILGNGSSDASLPGEIYILPDAANRDTWEYDDCLKIDISREGWGIKTNVVWGEHNNGEYNIAYVITNNNANVRKIMLTKRNGLFTGSYTVLGEWSTEAIDVNQGTVYRDGKLYIAVGHAQVWALVYTLNPDGSITVKQLKDVFYDAKGAELSAPFAEGITIENGLMYLGASDGRVLVYGTKAPLSTLEVEGEVPDDIMLRRHYDANNSGVVDDAEKLGGKAPGYYAVADHVHTAGEVEGYDGLRVLTGNPVQTELKGGRGISAVLSFDLKQAGSGDPSPSNIRTISGRTGVELTRCGKNLINPELADGAVTKNGITFTNNGNGTYTVNGTCTSDVQFVLGKNLPRMANIKFTCSPPGITTAQGWTGIVVDNDYSHIIWSGSTGSISSDNNVAILYCNNGNTFDNVLYKPMLTDDLTATYDDFVPYQGNTYSADFGQTVYGGGTLDWQTGVMTVDKAFVEYDGSADENWLSRTSATSGYRRFFIVPGDAEPNADAGNVAYVVSNMYKTTSPNGTYLKTTGICVNQNELMIYDADRATLTVDEWKAWLSEHPVQIAYKLATPTTIQLTPQEMIGALEGLNTIYTDASSMEVTFNHDQFVRLLWNKSIG